MASRTFFVHKLIMSKEPVVQFKLNLPADLKERLEHAAIDNKRSLSAEIIARLETTLTPPELISEETSALIKRLETLEVAINKALEAGVIKPESRLKDVEVSPKPKSRLKDV